jgi:CRISPR-associated protein (TIGR02710 family)
MGEHTTQPSCRAMLVSLGGSPEPVLYALSQQRPDYILFFVSAESAGQIQGIIRELPYQCRDFDRILSPSAEVLGDCYRVLRQQLPEKLAQWGLMMQDLMVDYTGGTKTMSAALVLATIEQVPRYSYVGGVERDKGGIGVVLGGRERMWYVQNPWQELAQEERKRVGLLFAAARYEAACQELQRMLARVEAEERDFVRALAELVEGYRDWDNFRHRDARARLGSAIKFLKPYAGGRRQSTLAQLMLEVEGHLGFLNQLTSAEGRGDAYILDLIANAERRADVEGKYEDGVARLYSCLERGAKFRLQRQYGISTDAVKPEQLPEALQKEFELKYCDSRDGLIKLPLMASYRLLNALGDDLGQRFMARLEEIMRLLSLRNLSPLGHGENPVGPEGYRRFRALVLDLLGIDAQQLPRFPTWPL